MVGLLGFILVVVGVGEERGIGLLVSGVWLIVVFVIYKMRGMKNEG